MLNPERVWVPIIAERERSTVDTSDTSAKYPCRGEYNRYLGCIGARKCHASGVSMCVLGQWPGEHNPGARRRSNTVDTPARLSPQGTVPADVHHARAAKPAPSHNRSVRPVVDEGARPLVGIVQDDRRVWQKLSRQVADAGFEPVWFSQLEAATAAVDGDAELTALLVDENLGRGTRQADSLFASAAHGDLPVLRLPSTMRELSAIESMGRMAVLWLTINLQAKQAVSS